MTLSRNLQSGTKVDGCWGVIIGMRSGELSLEQIRAFLEASQEVHFAGKHPAVPG